MHCPYLCTGIIFLLICLCEIVYLTKAINFTLTYLLSNLILRIFSLLLLIDNHDIIISGSMAQPPYPPGGYGDPNMGYPPQQPGYPPQAGYAPQQPGYPPQQPGYPPQQPGYPPQQPGYPPQQPGYPPQQPGYPPQQPGYPPQAGYPAQPQPGYPPQQPGYPAQQAGGYPPQQAGGYPPQQAYGAPVPGQQPHPGQPYGAPQPGYGSPAPPVGQGYAVAQPAPLASNYTPNAAYSGHGPLGATNVKDVKGKHSQLITPHLQVVLSCLWVDYIDHNL